MEMRAVVGVSAGVKVVKTAAAAAAAAVKAAAVAAAQMKAPDEAAARLPGLETVQAVVGVIALRGRAAALVSARMLTLFRSAGDLRNLRRCECKALF